VPHGDRKFRERAGHSRYLSGEDDSDEVGNVFAMLWAGGRLAAQANQDQQAPKQKPGYLTVKGCVSRSSGDFTVMQTDPADSYVLRPSGKLKLDPYLGQQVEVTGRETPTTSTSSNYNRRPASAVTIMVESIKTISRQCEG
jgi:hypothetical protein